ncbi:MAG TPA: hypothetical protein VGM98_05895, partial [Schlesneria sp.]
MSTINRESAFLNRFRSVWARKRRVELGQVGVNLLLLALLGLGLLAFADYRLELNLSARLAALAALTGMVCLFAAGSLWRRLQHWSQPTTAAEIEAAFPQLGQSVRTTVQFGTMNVEQVQSEGVATSLVTALAEQTRQQALPVPIEDVVPIKRLAWIGVALVAIAAAFAGALVVDWEWRNAASRALLGNDPYRQLEVLPGNQTVNEGGEATIDIALIGRTNREVLLFTRPSEEADADWTERELQKKDPEGRSPNSAHQRGRSTDPATALALNSESVSSASWPRAEFVAKLDRLSKPLEYRVTAGPLA